MKGRGKLGWILALVCALAAGCFLLTQERNDSVSQSLPVEPHDGWLQSVLGPAIYPGPRLKQATAAEFYQLSAHINLSRQFPHLQGEALERANREVSRCLNQAAMALPGKEWDVLLIRPENAAIIAGWHPTLARAQEDGFVKLALIQAIFRWHLFQGSSLDQKFKNCSDHEKWRALQAIVEGRTLALTRQQARRLGLEEFFPLLTERYLHVPDVSTDPGLRAMCQSELRQLHWASVGGLAFWDHIDKQGWPAAEVRVFARPPWLTEWIDRPELYVRREQSGRSDLLADLARLEKALPAEQWCGQQQAWTPAMVSQVANLFGEGKRAEKVLAGWEEGRSLVWQNKNHVGQHIGLSLARWETAAAARRYFGFVLELHRQRDDFARNPCGLSLKVIEARSHGIALPGADEAVYMEKKVQPANGGAALPFCVLLTRARAEVIEITWHGLPGDRAWAEKALANLRPE